MLIRHRLNQFINPAFVSARLLFVDGLMVPKHRNVLAVLIGPDGRRLHAGSNIVTNAGDEHYAERGAGETPSIAFASGGLRLGSAATAPAKTDTDVTTFIASTAKALSATYPKTNDADSDNTGSGVDIVTWLFEYGKPDFNANGIAEGAIVNNTTTPTAALTHFLFGAAFNKTADDTLKVFVNHEFLGS